MNWQTFEYRFTDFMILLILFIALSTAYKPRFKRPAMYFAVPGMALVASVLIILQEQISFGIFWLYLLVFLLTGSLFAAVFLKGQFLSKFAMVCVYCASYFLLNKTINALVFFFNGGHHMLGMRYMAQPVAVLSGYFLYKHAIRTAKDIPAIYPLSIAIVSILSVFVLGSSSLLGISLERNNPPLLLQNALIYMVLMIVDYVVFWLANSLIRRSEHSRLQVSLSTLTQSEKQMAAEADRLRRETHIIRHEVNNQLSTLAALLDRGDTVRARAMLDEICATLPAPADEIRSGNPVSDAVLNQKIAQARAQGIAVTADVCMDSSQSIRDTDLSALLSNLLNNALEASAKVEHPALDIHIYPAKNYLCISIRNRADLDALRKNPQLQTTKAHPEAHGLGIEIVREIVERYHGMVTFDADENGFFVVQVMLTLGEDGRK